MGMTDEHWCSICKKSLDKKKDEYTEFELVNSKKKGGSKKGIVCKKCVDKDEKLKEAMNTISKAGNPPFTPVIECLSWQKCETYEPIGGQPVRCNHISIIGPMVYCKRNHPGVTFLTQEEAELKRQKDEILKDYLQEALTLRDKKILKSIGSTLIAESRKKIKEEVYVPPSGVVESKEESNEKAGG